jgi:YggT family protein
VAVVCLAFTAYYIILFARVLLSLVSQMWSPPAYLSPAISALYTLTEPILGFVRRFLPPIGGLDFSPIVVFLALQLIASSIGC